MRQIGTRRKLRFWQFNICHMNWIINDAPFRPLRRKTSESTSPPRARFMALLSYHTQCSKFFENAFCTRSRTCSNIDNGRKVTRLLEFLVLHNTADAQPFHTSHRKALHLKLSQVHQNILGIRHHLPHLLLLQHDCPRAFLNFSRPAHLPLN